MALNPSSKQLIEKIYIAFENVNYPGDKNIINNPGRGCLEHDETEAFFKGKTWKDLTKPDVSLPVNYADMNFLSSAAWRYYLPAYLIQALTDISDDTQQDAQQHLVFMLTRLQKHVVFQLTPPELYSHTNEIDPALIKNFKELTDSLSIEQSSIIAQFLELQRSEFPDDYADDIEFQSLNRIINYWKNKAKQSVS